MPGGWSIKTRARGAFSTRDDTRESAAHGGVDVIEICGYQKMNVSASPAGDPYDAIVSLDLPANRDTAIVYGRISSRRQVHRLRSLPRLSQRREEAIGCAIKPSGGSERETSRWSLTETCGRRATTAADGLSFHVLKNGTPKTGGGASRPRNAIKVRALPRLRQGRLSSVTASALIFACHPATRIR